MRDRACHAPVLGCSFHPFPCLCLAGCRGNIGFDGRPDGCFCWVNAARKCVKRSTRWHALGCLDYGFLLYVALVVQLLRSRVVIERVCGLALALFLLPLQVVGCKAMCDEMEGVNHYKTVRVLPKRFGGCG